MAPDRSIPTFFIILKSTPVKIVDLIFAPFSLAPSRSTLDKFAPSKLAPRISELARLAPTNIASEKSALDAIEPFKRAPLKFAPLKFTDFVVAEKSPADAIPPRRKSADSKSAPCKFAFSIRAPRKSDRTKIVRNRLELLKSHA